MVTGSDIQESRAAVELAQRYREISLDLRHRLVFRADIRAAKLCYATVGVHPCNAKTFETYTDGPAQLLCDLEALAVQGKAADTVVAYGEIGLDYDRLFLSEKEVQLKYFEQQLDLATRLDLPLFLHSRAASDDFEALLRPRLAALPRKGLVHSFTGTRDEMERLVELGLDIGVNGCSLKTEENLDVVRAIPLDRLQLETDGPWVSVSSVPCRFPSFLFFVPRSAYMD